MSIHNNIEQKVEETLASLDGSGRAIANPFLYARIINTLKSTDKNFWSRALAFINRPAIAIASILLIIFMNALVLFQTPETSESNIQEDDQLFATEYNYSSTTTIDGFYTVNEEQP